MIAPATTIDPYTAPPRGVARVPTGVAGLRLALAVYSAGCAMPNGPAKSSRQPEARDAEDERTALETEQVTVLVVEDEESIAETLALIVEDAGFTALVARNGREALTLARQHHPQLIITDLMMPYLDGADLIAGVRADAVSRGAAPPPVIVVTAASRARAEASGADAVIIKPFDVTKIEVAMRRLLPGERY